MYELVVIGVIGLLGCISALVYVLPSIIAGNRKHPNMAAIMAVNFFAGWTFVGWVLALAWSLTDVRQRV